MLGELLTGGKDPTGGCGTFKGLDLLGLGLLGKNLLPGGGGKWEGGGGG